MLQKALNSRLGRADNTRFLEQFRYIIVASQLLSDNYYHGHTESNGGDISDTSAPQPRAFTLTGATLTASTSFVLVWVINWTRGGRGSGLTTSRVASVVTLLVTSAVLAYVYIRRKWLQYLRQQILVEASSFVGNAQNLDRSTAGAMTLVQEVELVSRGYRM